MDIDPGSPGSLDRGAGSIGRRERALEQRGREWENVLGKQVFAASRLW